MAEVLSRLVDSELNRLPAVNSYKLYYTATDPSHFAMNVCNGKGGDAHIGVWLIEAADVAWVDGAVPAPYQIVHENQRIEADGTDGNVWPMPTVVLDPGDRIVVRTDVLGVTFNGHGFKFIS